MTRYNRLGNGSMAKKPVARRAAAVATLLERARQRVEQERGQDDEQPPAHVEEARGVGTDRGERPVPRRVQRRPVGRLTRERFARSYRPQQANAARLVIVLVGDRQIANGVDAGDELARQDEESAKA
jgi:hypothetical protein